MITEERLKELIQQRATVYANGFGEIELIPENDIEIYENGKDSYIIYIFEPNRKYKNEIFAEELFETKEDAEFALEFQNIIRTETLNLPTWEEFKEIGEIYAFFGDDGYYCTIECYRLVTQNCMLLNQLFCIIIPIGELASQQTIIL